MDPGRMDLLEWNARSYDSLPLPHLGWGDGVIGQLRLTGDETVADVGCGTGRDAGRLLHLLPRGRVLAVDGSEQMLAQLRTRLAGQLGRVEVLRADLRQPLVLPSQVDAVMSVATLHWLPDHDVLFRGVAGALRPGGQFVAEAGGRGNIARVQAILAGLGVTDGGTGGGGAESGGGAWQFAGPDETRARLASAGFGQIDVRLVPDPVRLRPGAQLEEFLATVVLGAVLRDLPEAERQPFVRTVAGRLDEPVIDYVRLQLSAIRA